MKVLILEDEVKLAEYTAEILSKEGYETTTCVSIEEAIKKGLEFEHDIIILDLMLVGKGGEHLVEHLRKNKSKVPVLVLSALDQINTKVSLINMGADDYMTKPFDDAELVARVNALHRRYLDTSYEDKQEFGDIAFYWKQNKLVRGAKEISLTNKEADLFHFLLQNNGKTVKVEDILKKVWQTKVGYHSNVVQSTIRRLRRKVDSDFDHKLIHNVHGVGYTMIIPE